MEMTSTFKERVDRYFGVTERKSKFRVEVLAGFSTFLTMAYIVIVNPAILAAAGFDKSAVFFATIAVSAIATIAMGLWARLPFALAPGLEMDAYVAFFVIGVLGYNTEQALGVVFWSTMIFFLLSILGIRRRIIESIPRGMKHSLSTAIGVFVALIGLKLAGIVIFDGASPSGIGSVTSMEAIALYIGVGVILLCEKLHFRGGVLVSIIVVSVYCATQGLSTNVEPIEISSKMFTHLGRFDAWIILDPRSWAPILILFLVDFYGSVAKIIGLTINTTIYDNDTKQSINTSQGLYVDGIAAAMSPIVGTSSVTTFVESAVGIKVGGRTGITAIVCGILLLSTFLLAPLLNFVPVLATSGALIVVGWWLLPTKAVRATFRTEDWIIAIGMGIMAAGSFSLERSMLFGFLGYLFHIVIWKKEKPDIYLVISFLLLLIGVSLRLFGFSQ
jgi:AGZA family xanthine/uracil permease-like MFS transporter